MKRRTSCDAIIGKYAKHMLEGIAYTQKTHREYGFCARGKSIIRKCRGTKCAVTFYPSIPKHKMKGSFCFHTHSTTIRPEPSPADWDFFEWADIDKACISNIYGRTLCLTSDPDYGMKMPRRPCERLLVTKPVPKRGFSKFSAARARRRVRPLPKLRAGMVR